MKKNILFIIPTPLFPLGTSNYNSFRRVKELSNYNYKITIICPQIKDTHLKTVSEFKKNYKINVLDILQIKGIKGIKKHISKLLYNRKKIKIFIYQNKPDLIHIVNPPDLVPLLTSGLARNKKIPFIFHIADPGPESMATIFYGIKKHFFVFISSIIEKIIIRRSSALITVNNILKKQIIKTRNLTTFDFKVVYNVPERINIKNSKEKNIENSMVYIGTLSSEMIGLKDFISNYKKIQFWQKITLKIIGDGPHKNELEKICIEKNLINQIEFKGHLSYDQAMKILAGSTLALMPYKDTPLTRISLPTKLFEYISMSKAVVCPNLPGVIEILGIQNNAVYDVNKKDSIYKTINMLVKDKTLTSEIETNNFHISKKYTIEKEVKKIHDLYNSIL